jgi:VIT1/CCC1 family predicted Fe2+/Mn2+ transporter
MTESTRSIGDVVSDIVADLQQIMRAEVRLARTEIREELAKMRSGATLLMTAGVVGVLGLALLLMAAVFALATIWPLWASALAVGVAVAIIGALLGSAGLHRFRAVQLPPQKTVETVKENIQWAKTRTR